MLNVWVNVATKNFKIGLPDFNPFMLLWFLVFFVLVQFIWLIYSMDLVRKVLLSFMIIFVSSLKITSIFPLDNLWASHSHGIQNYSYFIIHFMDLSLVFSLKFQKIIENFKTIWNIFSKFHKLSSLNNSKENYFIKENKIWKEI